MNVDKYDVVIVGAGAAGLMCAIEAGKRGRKVLIIDHANKVGKKILMSGGGRCNFTNLHINPAKYISHNTHFCKSALSRYTQWDFIEWVKKHNIAFHEKTLGQLFCDHKSKDILDMLLHACHEADVEIFLNTTINNIQNPHKNHFKLFTTRGDFHCESLVIASGGLSIPTMGASPFGYKVAEQFGLKIWPTRAGLVPFTLQPDEKEKLSVLSGISIESTVSYEKNSFHENILFTHRGLSGPGILQISSYWQPGEEVVINLLPGHDLFKRLMSLQKSEPQKLLKSILVEWFPKRMIEVFFNNQLLNTKLASVAYHEFKTISKLVHEWSVKPNGTEGYRTAEVTLGGVDCDEISSKTMEVTKVQGLYFIGEVVDVTGWLGGYNFQWAWSSGWAAGQVV
jgi:predicted Rossmann fold flavoprotein